MNGMLWGPYLGASHSGDEGPGVLSFDGLRTLPGGRVRTDPVKSGPHLWTDGTRLYAEGSGTRVGLGYGDLRGAFQAGEVVRQASTGATGLFVRITPDEIILLGQTAGFLATGGADQGVVGLTSGASARPTQVTLSPNTNFLERSDDGRSDFTPVMDVLGTSIEHSFVDCGKVASLGGRHLLLWFDYVVVGHTPGVWYNYPDEETEWHHLFTADLGSIKHFHGGVLMPGVDRGRDRLFVMTGDTDPESSILLCDDLGSLVTQPALWKHRWALDATGSARTAALRTGDGRQFCIGAGSQRYRAVDLIHDPASGYVYYVPDSTLGGVDTLMRFTPDTGVVQPVGQTHTKGSGWFGVRTSSGRILFTSVPERWGGVLLGDCDGYLRLWLLTPDGKDLVELRRWNSAGPPGADGLWGFKNVLEYGGAVWLPALGYDVLGGTAVGRLLDSAAGADLETDWASLMASQSGGPPADLVVDGNFNADPAPYFTARNCRMVRQQQVGPESERLPNAVYLTPSPTPGPSYARQVLPAEQVRGHWAYFSVSVLAPTSLPATQAVGAEITDGKDTRFVRLPNTSDSWQTLTTPVFVPNDAPYLHLRLYARSSLAGDGGVYFSRISLVPGALAGFPTAQAVVSGSAAREGGAWTYRYTITRTGPPNARALRLPVSTKATTAAQQLAADWVLLGPIEGSGAMWLYTDQAPSPASVDPGASATQPSALTFSLRSPSGPAQGDATLIDDSGGVVVQTVPVPSGTALLGDMNGDGRLNIADAVAMLRLLIAPNPPPPDAVATGDLNGDGRLTIADVVLLLRRILGLDHN
jgi:hypothetical protein